MSKELAHKGDPCIFCETPHDDVAVGNCPGLEVVPSKALTAHRELRRLVEKYFVGFHGERNGISPLDIANKAVDCRKLDPEE